MPLLISGLVFRVTQRLLVAILKILIFRRFLADRRSKFDQKHEKSQNFDLQSAKNRQKIKIFQIATRNLCITLKPSPDIKTGILSVPSLHIFGL